MDTQALRNAYDGFHATAAEPAAPADGGWSAELVVAHRADRRAPRRHRPGAPR
jgi:hypothetical protein